MGERTQVTVGRTFNLGNYRSLRVELTADIGHTETAEEVALSIDQELHDIKDAVEQNSRK